MKEEPKGRKNIGNPNNKPKTKFSRIIIIIISSLLLITVVFFYGYTNQDVSCKPNWICGEWSVCKAGIQTRVCSDLNNCNTTVDRPIESQQCICVEDWSCIEWSNCSRLGKQNRVCEDKNICGSTANKPPDLQSCAPPKSSEYILQLSDFPQGWILKERAEILKSDINAEESYWGWKEGYKVSYVLMIDWVEKSQIDQFISIYPLESISYPIENETAKITKTALCEKISAPNIGNTSLAYRCKLTTFFIDYTSYAISFSKFDIFEQITLSGSIKDVELLKELAVKAADKII